MARGDHIFVDDRLAGIPFQHHGIDLGDGTVIHLAPKDGARATLRDRGQQFAVRRVTIEQFSGGRAVRVCAHVKCRSPEDVVSQAESLLGQTGYSLIENNCEHFATYCATGVATSRQIEMSQATLTSFASLATKTLWAVAARVGTQAVVRGAVKMHPAALLADGVELAALGIGCRSGVDAERAQRVAQVSGSVAAAGIGAVVGGPIGAAAGLVAHSSSRAIAEKACWLVRQVLS